MCLLSASALADVSGTARVVAGDVIAIGTEEIRLAGIDAPEIEQTCETRHGKPYDCGINAANHLRLLVGQHEITCKGSARDNSGRLLATCYLGRHDLNRQMVIDGWALADPGHSAKYAREELAAQQVKEGIWKGRFVAPWAWRNGKRLPAGGKSR